MMVRACAYCGSRFERRQGTRDHVAPKCLYPARTDGIVPRITVPACMRCNAGWSDDEAHFRTVMLLASGANAPARALWSEKALPSIHREVDAKRRLHQLRPLLRTTDHEGEPRLTIYPAEDAGVMRIVRKVVRGLAHYHRLTTAVPEANVRADVLRYRIPPVFADEMLSPVVHNARIFAYRYCQLCEPEIDSAWVLTFYESCTFIGVVGPGIAARHAA